MLLCLRLVCSLCRRQAESARRLLQRVPQPQWSRVWLLPRLMIARLLLLLALLVARRQAVLMRQRPAALALTLHSQEEAMAGVAAALLLSAIG